MDTERIDFEDGHYWEFYVSPTRGMAKKFRKAQFKSVSKVMQQRGMDIDDPEAIKSMLAEHPDLIDLDALEDAWLLHGTAKTSLVKKPTPEALDALDDRYVSRVLDRMRELYSPPDEEAVRNLDGTQSPSTLVTEA